MDNLKIGMIDFPRFLIVMKKFKEEKIVIKKTIII